MSEIKTLEDMRNTVKTIAADCDEGWILGCLDAIEGEIAERFVELPVDADGVPIRVGDYLQLGETRGEVVALTYRPDSKFPWGWQCDTGDWYSTAFAYHVKPRTLESILCGALADVSCMGDGIVRTFNPDEPYVAGLAAEIRELLGVSE